MKTIWQLWLLAFAVKLFLIFSYRSTDFEVHRNWLAITASLPYTQWYYEKTSEWTLDYPPFFALFEYILTPLAAVFDKKMLIISATPYASILTIVYQRGTVILTELLFFYACHRFTSLAYRQDPSVQVKAMLLAFLNPGLLIVDHIHFQYNGFLFGVLILSLSLIEEDRPVLAAMVFAILLNLKHIYLYLAPAYFVYLFRSYCFTTGKVSLRTFRFERLVQLGAVVLAVFAASLGPFYTQLPQLVKRLFPFKRGLCHAYWAANFWSLYSFMDRLLIKLYLLLNYKVRQEALGAMTKGLVGESAFGVLPVITPSTTLLCTVAFMVPVLWKLWRRPSKLMFYESLILCGYASFMFGWHVHEKAVLLIILPMSLIYFKSPDYASIYMPLQWAGHIGLLPLLYRPEETPIKLCAVALYTLLLIELQPPPFLERSLVRYYMWGWIPVQCLSMFSSLILEWHQTQQWRWRGLFEVERHSASFLPLMLTSVYCALGVTYSFLKLYLHIVVSQ